MKTGNFKLLDAQLSCNSKDSLVCAGYIFEECNDYIAGVYIGRISSDGEIYKENKLIFSTLDIEKLGKKSYTKSKGEFKLEYTFAFNSINWINDDKLVINGESIYNDIGYTEFRNNNRYSNINYWRNDPSNIRFKETPTFYAENIVTYTFDFTNEKGNLNYITKFQSEKDPILVGFKALEFKDQLLYLFIDNKNYALANTVNESVKSNILDIGRGISMISLKEENNLQRIPTIFNVDEKFLLLSAYTKQISSHSYFLLLYRPSLKEGNKLHYAILKYQ